MKLILICLSLSLIINVNAAEKMEIPNIAKTIQCTFLRDKSFFDINELYSIEKTNPEYIKKVSDSIYGQAFKICGPENETNADKEILSVCSKGCDQFVSKGILGIGGPSSTDIEKCKKMCLNYSDLLGINFSAATSALKKYIELNPPAPKKIETVEVPATSNVAPTPDPTKAEIKAPVVE